MPVNPDPEYEKAKNGVLVLWAVAIFISMISACLNSCLLIYLVTR